MIPNSQRNSEGWGKKAEGITVLHFKTSYEAVVTKTAYKG
jgi:hypothetical protein